MNQAGAQKRKFLRGGAERQFGGSGGLPRIFFQIWPLIRAFSEQLGGGVPGLPGGGAPDHFGMPGGGARPRAPPHFAPLVPGHLHLLLLLKLLGMHTVLYTLVVQLRTKFKTIQLCSLLMCIET